VIHIDFLVQYGPALCVAVLVICAVLGYVRDRRRRGRRYR
jgi:hypothetical protein